MGLSGPLFIGLLIPLRRIRLSSYHCKAVSGLSIFRSDHSTTTIPTLWLRRQQRSCYSKLEGLVRHRLVTQIGTHNGKLWRSRFINRIK